MIRINLAPVEELDNPYWWVPDVLVFSLILGLSLTGVKYYLGMTQNEIDRLSEEQIRLTENLASLEPELVRFNDLNDKIKNLEFLRTSLGRITESKLTRYLPIILLEHIQNLKPEGVWLTGIRFKEAAEAAEGSQPTVTDGLAEIEITGNAFDNVILAEFMTLLKATRNQEYDAGDLRTQLFFEQIGLYFSDIQTVSAPPPPLEIRPGEVAPPPQTTVQDLVSFKLGVTYQERTADTPTDMRLSRYLEEYRKSALKGGTYGF